MIDIELLFILSYWKYI